MCGCVRNLIFFWFGNSEGGGQNGRHEEMANFFPSAIQNSIKQRLHYLSPSHWAAWPQLRTFADESSLHRFLFIHTVTQHALFTLHSRTHLFNSPRECVLASGVRRTRPISTRTRSPRIYRAVDRGFILETSRIPLPQLPHPGRMRPCR